MGTGRGCGGVINAPFSSVVLSQEPCCGSYICTASTGGDSKSVRPPNMNMRVPSEPQEAPNTPRGMVLRRMVHVSATGLKRAQLEVDVPELPW